MHKLFFILLLLSSALTVCMSARSAQAWQSPEAEIVVLTNHQTIQGIVQQQQEKVSVRLPSGSLIVLPKSRVLLVSQTLSEVYWELAARTRSTDAKGQIDVYKWCVRNHLFDEAANHLLMLQEMDIPAKTLMQLDVSLQLTKKRQTQSQQKIAAAQTNPITMPQRHREPNAQWQGDQSIEIPNLHDTAQTSTNTDRLPTIDEFGAEVDIPTDGNVQQVSWDQPISENVKQSETLVIDETLRRRLGVTETLSYSDLNRLSRSMPHGSVGLFRKQVEPVLRQACSNCHQADSTDSAYKFFHGHNGMIDRRMSQKNLFQALNLANRMQPEESLLIRYATVAHGNQSRPSFQWQDAQLKAVKKWLIMVSDNPSLPLEKFASDRAKDQSPRLATPKVAEADDAFSKRLPANSPAAKSEAAEHAGVSAGSVDPFDADTFNRKFGVR